MATTTKHPVDAPTRSLSTIAHDIRQHWPKVNYAAKPYLEAMADLNKITDSYYMDSGASVVRYFLANASTWVGSEARRVKAELNHMLKGGVIMANTKGSWHFSGVHQTAQAKSVCHLYEADGRYTGITIETLVNGNGQYMDDVRDRNQALVEAAPELLEALRRLVWEHTSKGPYHQESHDHNMRIANIAIAKAEGRP